MCIYVQRTNTIKYSENAIREIWGEITFCRQCESKAFDFGREEVWIQSLYLSRWHCPQIYCRIYSNSDCTRRVQCTSQSYFLWLLLHPQSEAGAIAPEFSTCPACARCWVLPQGWKGERHSSFPVWPGTTDLVEKTILNYSILTSKEKTEKICLYFAYIFFNN